MSLGENGGGRSGGETDLFQLALRVAPKTEDGFEATYGDVFSWLMTNMATRLNQEGDVAYLTFSGTVSGGDYPLSIVLVMTGISPDNKSKSGAGVHDVER